MTAARIRVVVAVAAGWLAAAVLWGAQTSIASSVSGENVVAMGPAIGNALTQTLPWIPVTLAVIALTVRLPVSRHHWQFRLPVHIVAAVALAFVANVLLVLSFQVRSGKFGSLPALAHDGAVWTTVRLHFGLLIYIAVAALTQTVIHFRDLRARELHTARIEGQLARARLDALTAQIRPHFLFNTLHTIGQLWRSGRSDDADAMLDRLGSLFHKVQHSTSRTEVTLAEELELVRDYLAIEGVRFRDRLTPTVSAAQDIMNAMVPPLILQPIVENAVKHGISAVSTARALSVTAERVDHCLRLTVRDDGPGFSATSPHKGSGTGIQNTRERLAQLYGDRAQLRSANVPSGGVVVTIELPFATTSSLDA